MWNICWVYKNLSETVFYKNYKQLTKLCDSCRESGDFLCVWQRYSDAVLYLMPNLQEETNI